MSDKFLLIDFGASRVKSALLSDGRISDIADTPPVVPCIKKGKRFEVSLKDIRRLFIDLASSYALKYKIDGIFVCSEMHGFALIDNNNQPLSNYISWQDERCLEEINGISSFEMLKEILGESFFHKTGMFPRACHPIFNLFHLVRQKKLKRAKVISLPEWLCACDGSTLNIAHSTMSAGLGLYNIYSKCFDEELISALGHEAGFDFNTVSHNVVIGGHIDLNGRKTPVYTGVGDHQCATLGAGNDTSSISVNLGTGSQIALIDHKNDNCESRPFFDGQMLKVITHIPSGRALNVFAAFFGSINPELDFWGELSTVTLEEMLAADLNINLGLFSSAWRYSGGGSVTAINENNLTKRNFLSSLLRNYAQQYKEAIQTIVPSSTYTRMVLSGGISRKLPVLAKYLESSIGIKATITQSAHDETLEGLRIIATNITSVFPTKI